ncbi:MAG TPA: PIN domain-containing protein [Acidimicrobiales bacterium]|nr:PIN domain-containing protein [Acidimicrobiales bacterium]
MDAFDADVLIYAAAPGHPLGRRVRALFPAGPVERSGPVAGVGSVLLVPELLAQPMHDRSTDELVALGAILSRLELLPTDQSTAELAAALGASYGMRAADAVHLATAVTAAADRFITNNRADFPQSISEIAITYPDELPDPSRH